MTALASSDVAVALSTRNQNIVRGNKVVSLVGLTFGDGVLTYPTGGVPLPDNGYFGLKRELQLLLINQPHGNGYVYRFDADNRKIKILQVGQISQEEKADAGSAYAVVHAASPGGNAIYLKYGTAGPYLCCNMGTDAADKAIAFAGGQNLIVKHDASAASGGLAVTFDEDGVAGAQLLVNNTLTGADDYLGTDTPDAFLKVKHDADAATHGVVISYDDGTDEQIEATFAGTANVDLSLSAYVAADGGSLEEVPAATTPAEVSFNALMIGE